MKHLLLALVVACSGGSETSEAETSEAETSETETAAETEADPETEAETEVETDTEPEFVSAAGLTVHRSLRAPQSVVRAARRDWPSSIAPILTFGAGDEGSTRVYWIAFVTSRFAELRGRAIDEGRLEAFDADIDRRMRECEENEEVGDCDYCTSSCDLEVYAGERSNAQELHLVRVTAPTEGSPRVDGTQKLFGGDEQDETRLRIRDIDDLDGDGRPEIALGLDIHHEDRAGDGGSDTERHIVIDADRLHVQIEILKKEHIEGHTGSIVAESRVSFQDRNGDGRADYAVRYTYEDRTGECTSFGEDEPHCAPRDEARRAHYSIDDDAWVLAEGETWPWLSR